MASGFDGELDNFQQPELSSLGNWCVCIMVQFNALIDRFLSIEYGRYPAAMISYAPSDSLVDKQGMIAQEFTFWDTPGKRKTYIASFLLT
jgi:hypothetical protein